VSNVRNLSGKAERIHALIEEGLRVRGVLRFEHITRLEKLFPSSENPQVDFLGLKRFLYLEPIVEGGHMLPVLSLRCNFKSASPEVRLEVGLFLVDGAGELRAIGYRFETPEGEAGKHHYHHAQLFRNFQKQAAWCLPCPPWLPTEQPSFVLSATDGVTLLINVLLSMYGRTYLGKFSGPLWSLVKDYVDKMRLG